MERWAVGDDGPIMGTENIPLLCDKVEGTLLLFFDFAWRLGVGGHWNVIFIARYQLIALLVFCA